MVPRQSWMSTRRAAAEERTAFCFVLFLFVVISFGEQYLYSPPFCFDETVSQSGCEKK
jgi:hypothetical protein